MKCVCVLQNERQQKLQQMARQLIAETKQKSTDNSPSKKYESPQISPIKKLGYTIGFDNFSKISPSHRIFEKNGNGSPLNAFNVGDKISPKIEKRGLVSCYIFFYSFYFLEVKGF